MTERAVGAPSSPAVRPPSPEERRERTSAETPIHMGRATAVMAGGTLLSRLTGLGRNLALALFGFAALSDAYLLANNSPNIVFELVLGGVLSATLVPVFVELLRIDDDDARRGISAIATLAMVTAVALAVGLTIGAPWMIRLYTFGRPGAPSADQAAKRDVAVTLLRMFGPQVAVYGFITVATALLNARRRFAAPMFAPILNNLVVVAVLVVAKHRLDALARSTGVSSPIQLVRTHRELQLLLGLGTSAGVLAMGLALLPSLLRSGLRLRPVWDPRHPAVRTVVRLSGWTMGYVIANQAALYFVVWAANRGADGDYSAYASAYSTFFVLPHGIFAVSIMTALQPQLSDDYLERRRGRFRRHVRQGGVRVLAVIVPAAVGYLVLARPIVELILRHRSMSLRSANLTADTLRAFAIGLPGFSVYLLLMNAFKALRDTRATFTINAVENVMNIVFAAVLYPRYGVQGLALAFGLAYLIAAVIAAAALARRTAGLGTLAFVGQALRIGSASAVMGVSVWGASRAVGWVMPDSLPRAAALFVQVGGAMVVGVTVYVIACRAVGVDELSATVAGLRRRLSRHPVPRRP